MQSFFRVPFDQALKTPVSLGSMSLAPFYAVGIRSVHHADSVWGMVVPGNPIRGNGRGVEDSFLCQLPSRVGNTSRFGGNEIMVAERTPNQHEAYLRAAQY